MAAPSILSGVIVMYSRPRRALARALLAASALSAPAFAQSPAVLPPIDAEEVDAAPPSDPGETEINATALKRRGVGSSDTIGLLRGLPGVAVSSNGGFSSLPVVRGLADDRVLVTVDGQAITSYCPNHMNPAGSYVLPSRVESIALMPSLSPVSAGGDNIAGVIAIATHAPAFAEPGAGWSVGGSVGASYRSVADAMGASAGLLVQGEHVSLSYDGSWSRAENYKAGGGRRVRATLYEVYDHAATLAIAAGPGVVSLRAGRHYSPYEGFPTQRMDMTANESDFVDLAYEAAYGWGELSARASWRTVDHEMNFLQDKGGAANGGMPMISKGEDLSAQIAASLPLEDGGSFKLGLDAFSQDLDDYWPPVAGSMMMGPLTYLNINGGRRERLGLWGEWNAVPSPDLSTQLGVRLEQVRTDTGDVQPYSWMGMMNAADAAAATAFNALDRARSDVTVDVTAKAVWRASDIATLEIGYARKTRAPNLYERYAWGRGFMSSAMTSFAGDANSYVGDPDLKPEVANTFAATFRLAGVDGKAEVTIGGYYTLVEDFIDAVKLADRPGGFVFLQFANVDARIMGIDATGRVELCDDAASGKGTLTVSAAWVEGENRDTGGDLYHMQPLTVRLGLEHEIGRWSSAAELELVAEKSAVDTLRHEPVTGRYALLNLRTSWQGEAVRVDLAIENVFDAAYDLPLGGVSYGDYDAGGQVPPIRALPGPGRSFNVGLSVPF